MKDGAFPPVMILCGGRGTRLRDVTEVLPKPMVPIGPQPILWHIMRSFAAFGARRFILCLGYKREVFVDYFLNGALRTTDATITLGREPSVVFHEEPAESGWEVTLAGTGLDTLTGGRVLRAARYLRSEDRTFFLSYGDGLADIDLAALLRQHRESGALLTVSAVHPETRFGELALEGDRVTAFAEKPAQTGGTINGGYMVIERAFIKRYLAPDPEAALEGAPMARAAAAGDMRAYRHEGFWQCMDNQREYHLLNDIWASGRAPWTKYWKS